MGSERIRVGVLFGGKSGEHEVSLLSAKSVMDTLDPAIYDVVPIGITKEGKWIPGLPSFEALGIEVPVSLQKTEVTVTPTSTGKQESNSNSIAFTITDPASFSSFPNLANQHLDVVIPVLHGPHGEDGTVQGMLELLDLPYVGGGVLASAVSMDKIIMKTVFAKAGLEQCKYIALLRKNWEQNSESALDQIEQDLGYPCFVKPANLGSSVGISKAKNREELIVALNFAAEYDRRIIIEEGIDAREIEVAVLGNDDPRASLPGEIIPGAEFYDYNDKYLDGKTSYQIPATLPKEVQEEFQKLAIHAYQAVDGAGLSRVDFFLERGTNRILINEINTFPGFTKFSMYPKLWEISGLSYKELLDHLISLAFERYAEKHR